MAEGRPRFRRDLDAKPIEIDGIAYVDATDPRSGTNFRFYDFEHSVAEVLDGRALGEVVPDARARSGFELTAEQLAAFTERLRELGFLESGDDDATHSGSAPVAPLEVQPTSPVFDEDVLAATPIVPSGSTEKLPTLDLPSGSTEKLPTLDPPAPDTKEPPVEQPPVEEPPAEPSANTEKAPVNEPGAPGPERKVTRELFSGRSPTEAPVPPPALTADPADARPALRVGELRSALASPRPMAPSAELEQVNPPAEANVVAPDLDDDQDDEPTNTHRRPDDNKGTLFGVPFQEREQMVAAARDKVAATPPPVVETKAEPKAEPQAKPVLEINGARKDATPASTDEAKPAEVSLPPVGPSAGPFALLTAAPSSPFPPAVEVPAAPFPPASTPEPMPALLPSKDPSASNGAPARTNSAEVPALAPTTPSSSPRRISPFIFAGAGVVAAAAIGVFGFRLSSSSEPGPLSVRTIVPTAGSTFRWFDTVGTVKAAGERTLTFTTGGRVIRIMSPGTAFAAGDLIAEVEGAPQFKGAVDHNKRRLAFYEQRLEAMTKENNRPEMRQAELKIAEKKRLIAAAQVGLARQGVIATHSGEIAEALVAPGATVKPGAPAVRIKGSSLRAEFELSREDADRVRHLGFCRAEIDGKPVDCSLSPEGGDETHVFVDLPTEAALGPGKPVRLAKARYDDVFVLPATALAPTKGLDRRVYVVKDGRAESYAVVLADQTPTEIVVTQGLEPGSAVVAEVPPALRPRAAVKAVPAKQ